MYSITINSPIGYLEICSNETALLSISFIEHDKISDKIVPEILLKSKQQLIEYFSGLRKEFELNIELTGTDFQKKYGMKYQKQLMAKQPLIWILSKLPVHPKTLEPLDWQMGRIQFQL